MIYDCRDKFEPINDAQIAFEEFIRLQDQVKKALLYNINTHDPVHIWQGIFEGTFDFYVGEKSMAVAELLLTPKCKIYQCFFIAGEMAEVQRIIELGKQTAIRRDADFLQCIGRKGWSKVLQQFELNSYIYTTEA